MTAYYSGVCILPIICCILLLKIPLRFLVHKEATAPYRASHSKGLLFPIRVRDCACDIAKRWVQYISLALFTAKKSKYQGRNKLHKR